MQRFLSGFAAASLASAAAIASNPPELISYQGVLDNAGSPVNGPQNIVFRLYSAASGGDQILVDSHVGGLAIAVNDGLFTAEIGGGIVTDGAGPGAFTSLGPVFRNYSTVYLEVEVAGQILTPRQRMISVGFALDARTLDGAESGSFLRSDTSDSYSSGTLSFLPGTTLSLQGGVTAASGTNVTVSGGAATLAFTGSNLQMFIGDTISDQLIVQSTISMLPTGSADVDQRIQFLNGGTLSESLLWDDSDDRFEFSDSLAISGPIQVGSVTVVSQVYSAFGAGTPVSSGMNSANDVLVTDDIECLSSIIASGNILMHAGAAEGDSLIYFREDGSDNGESFRWDDSADKFVVSDAFQCDGNLTVNDPDGFADVQSAGGITIRIDTDNNESGPNAGVFSINANAADLFGTPLLQIQSTDEANLLLDNGVQTDAFDFAEAFKPIDSEFDMQPGDVVCLVFGEGMTEHMRRSTGAAEEMLLGVVSTRPAFTCGMGIDSMYDSDPALKAQMIAAFDSGDRAEYARLGIALENRMKEIWRPVALLGRVPCKVDASNGPIRAGDRVTSSGANRGAAMRQTDAGMSIGVAMEDFAGAGTGTITVLVRSGWWGGAAKPTPTADTARLDTLERENRDLKARLEAIEKAISKR